MEDKILEVLIHFLSLHEAHAVEDMINDDEYTSQDILQYISWCKRRYEQNLSTDFEEWLEDRKPRVFIGFCVTEFGTPASGTLWFPKRGEDMSQGTEYEWYYSLKEIEPEIMKLKVGESIPFKIRDDKDSVGTVTRLK